MNHSGNDANSLFFGYCFELASPASSGSVIGPLAEKVIQNLSISSGILFSHPAEGARTPFFLHFTRNQSQARALIFPLDDAKFALQNTVQHEHTVRFETGKNARA